MYWKKKTMQLSATFSLFRMGRQETILIEEYWYVRYSDRFFQDVDEYYILRLRSNKLLA